MYQITCIKLHVLYYMYQITCIKLHVSNYTPTRIKGRATNFGAGQDGRQFFGAFY